MNILKLIYELLESFTKQELALTDEECLSRYEKLIDEKTKGANITAHVVVGMVMSLKKADVFFNKKKFIEIKKLAEEAVKEAHEIPYYERIILVIKKRIEDKQKVQK